jgi:hypothetical protein
MEKNRGGGEKGVGRAGKNAIPKENHITATPTLEELDLDKKTSMVAQPLAAMPEEVRQLFSRSRDDRLLPLGQNSPLFHLG